MVSCALVIFYTYVPTLLGPAIMILNCPQFESGYGATLTVHSRWSAYLANDCTTQWHKSHQLFSLIWLGTIAFGFQMITLLIMWLQRFNLDDIEMRLKFGYIYNDYKKQYYYWEFVKMFVKMVLVGLAIVIELDIKYRTIALLIIFTAYLLLTKRVRPYAEEELNIIDQELTYAFIITVALLPAINSTSASTAEEVLTWGAIIALFTINLNVVIRLGGLLVCEYFKQIRRAIEARTKSAWILNFLQQRKNSLRDITRSRS
jgi:hypothetical protein